ncbi:pilus assembly protein [Psychromonas aquimarina]|uniref:pilus assembly protein n=1 Tax=Psychromonas aquimarina TaxID=444919 RepID=UPI000407E71D|nr:PilC/PilY family type IV pilus protein [Psychromonas aquimarina]
MLIKRLLIGILCSFCSILLADDTELFVSDVSAQNGIRPQVLIIFDTSGSMRSSEEVIKEAYDPARDYGAGSNANKIYWTREGGDTPGTGSSQYFLTTKNNCQASLALLSSAGLYNGNVRRWVPNKRRSSRSRWKTLSGNSGTYFECKEDVLNAEPANPATPTNPGFPKDGRSGPYISTVNNVFSGSDAVTLFSANYIYWYNTVGVVSKSRLLIAKEAIESLIESTPSVDFGLEVFNRNSGNSSDDKNGGRIISKVKTRDAAQTQTLINQVLNLNADGWTPLCESLYEAYRYYAGKGVYYGNDDSYSTPARDTSAEESSVYISPFKACQERAYIILMTDGEPTNDGAANSLINTLTGNGSIENSYMPTLSEWMNNFDIDDDADNGAQHITTYTIGFGQSAVDAAGRLLRETAERGGGEYYPATSSTALQKAFQATILDILNSSSSLSSPAIANNNFDRTRSLDSVYYSMFMPSNLPVWQGNIKKLTMNASGILVDRFGAAAINSDGNIKDNASTYWGAADEIEDGNAVSEGGVAAMLAEVTSRTILSNINADTLKAPTLDNLKAYYGVTTAAEVASELSIAESDLTGSLNWLTGLDVDDDNGDSSVTDYRSDIFADPLHSKPLAITYIENGKQVVRLLVGTNAGFLHMFTDNTNDELDQTDDTITENWAFIPAELLPFGLSLRDAPASSEHQYGMDLSPIAIKIYDSGSLQKIIAIVGMRRGGGSYYAVDITNHDVPKLAWKIDAATSGFSELAQTWSMPSIGTFAYKVGSEEKVEPGLVFGGGYDTNKDTCIPSDSETCNDVSGRAVYIVNAVSGEKIWSVDGSSCAEDDKHCIRDSIPSQVSLLDGDGDGYIDRLYTGDTGGNLWRMDFAGTDTSKWSTIKLAVLGGDTASTDRRFFVTPVVVRTYENHVTKSDEGVFTYSKVPYDGILLGSGDRAHPASSTDVDDSFFSVRDYNINPTLFGVTGFPDKPTSILNSQLFDITDDPVGSYDGSQILNVFADMSGYKGWKYQLTSAGEKSLGQAAVLEGTVYFTSFVPNSTVNIGCGVGDLGTGWLYAVDLHSGEKRFSNEQGVAVAKKDIGSRVPDSLVIHAGEDEQEDSVIRLLGVGQGDEITVFNEETQEEEKVFTGTVDTNTDMMPRRIYSYFKEK